ncbi:MAG: response regulator, partial [Planctomycetota bacterium]
MSAEYNTHDPYQGVKHASDPSPTVRLEEHLEALERHAALVADDQAMNTMDSGNPPRDQASNQSDTIHVESEARRSQLLDREIMIVDDEPLIVEATRYHLGSVGYRNLESYCDSRDAVERLKTHCPDVLLLDMVMPNLSGIYILHLVSSSDHLMHLPVIVMTAERCPTSTLPCSVLGS